MALVSAPTRRTALGVRDIEVTALIGVPDDADADTILREAEALAKVGVHTIVARSASPEPVRWLEQVWAPVTSRLAAIRSA